MRFVLQGRSPALVHVLSQPVTNGWNCLVVPLPASVFDGSLARNHGSLLVAKLYRFVWASFAGPFYTVFGGRYDVVSNSDRC